jgi:O-antigen/teichoic acid export membrane protein
MLVVLLSVSLNINGNQFIYFYYAPHFALAMLVFYIVMKRFLNRIHTEADVDQKSQLESSHLAQLPTYPGILKVAIPMLGVTLSNAVIINTDILMLSSFTDEQTVGIYSVYVKIAALMGIAIAAVNSMYAPKAARLFGSGKVQELKVLTKRATFLSFSVSCAALACILLVHKPLLSLYGAVFSNHMSAFYILLFSMLCNSYYGSIGMLLNMTGKQNRFFIIMSTAALINAVLNYYLIPEFGPIGAAWATLATVLYWNTLAAITVKTSFGFTTFPAIRNR